MFCKIVLYLFSRVVMALVKLPVKRELLDAPQHTYPIFAAVIWGAVMVRKREREKERGDIISPGMFYFSSGYSTKKVIPCNPLSGHQCNTFIRTRTIGALCEHCSGTTSRLDRFPSPSYYYVTCSRINPFDKNKINRRYGLLV